MRKLLIVCGILAVLIVVAAIALPYFVDADSFRPRVESELQSSLARPVQIGRLRLSLLAGGVTAENITVADDPAFSRAPFLKAKSIDIGVDLGALLFSKTLNVRSITLVAPEVALLRSPAGKWNFASLGAKQPVGDNQAAGKARDFSIQRLRVLHGRVGIGNAGGKQHTYEDITLDASDISYTSPIPFVLEATTPGGGKLRVEGHAGPVDRADASRTPLQAQVKITGMDLARTGLSSDSGFAGLLDYSGTVASDGNIIHTEGTAKTQQLQLVKGGSPARQPVSFTYASDYDLKRRSGALMRGDMQTGNSLARISGAYDARGEDVVAHMKLAGQNLPVQDVAGLLPALGVSLPAGSSLQGGSVTVNLSLDGPFDKLVTTGDLNVSNVKLANFNLGSKMSAIAALAGIRTGADTTIQMMSSRLRIAPEGIRADDLNLVVPELGTVTGAGTVSGNNALNFRLNAKLANASLVGGLTRVAGLGQTNKGVPFLVQGTTSNPVFLPDVGGMVSNTVQAPAQGLGGILGGLFGKKKK
jgi:AsmA protein